MTRAQGCCRVILKNASAQVQPPARNIKGEDPTAAETTEPKRPNPELSESDELAGIISQKWYGFIDIWDCCV